MKTITHFIATIFMMVGTTATAQKKATPPAVNHGIEIWTITDVQKTANGFALAAESKSGVKDTLSTFNSEDIQILIQFFQCSPEQLKGRSFDSDWKRTGHVAIGDLVLRIRLASRVIPKDKY